MTHSPTRPRVRRLAGGGRCGSASQNVRAGPCATPREVLPGPPPVNCPGAEYVGPTKAPWGSSPISIRFEPSSSTFRSPGTARRGGRPPDLTPPPSLRGHPARSGLDSAPEPWCAAPGGGRERSPDSGFGRSQGWGSERATGLGEARGQGPCLRSQLPAVNPGLCASNQSWAAVCLSLAIYEKKMVVSALEGCSQDGVSWYTCVDYNRSRDTA